MNIVAENIGVDAGLIMVGDFNSLSGFNPNFKELKRLGKEFKVPNGYYRVSWSIGDTWNGDIQGVEFLEVTSGKIFICDPCYLVADSKWDKWLDKTNYGEDLDNDNAFIISSMGGDGSYLVNLTLEKTDKIFERIN